MENQNTTNDQTGGRMRNRNRPLGGVVLIIIGSVLLARQLDIGPYWIFSWPMILIGIGVFLGAQNSFRPGGWIVPVIIGTIFLVMHELDRDMRHYFWPVFIIGWGVYMIFRPRRNRWDKGLTMENSSDDFIDSSVVFGGVKKKVITKSFQGGKIENLFGGTDIDMMQADFQGTVVMEFNVAFGGIKLVVPPHWNIKNEITVILGGVDDKRPTVQTGDARKVLVLRGTVMFGGVDIKSY